ncbi:MAG: hypothetical protein ABEN55_04345 [Bradymonadaceae bacterium]
MFDRETTQPPSREIDPDTWFATVKRVARRTAGPVLLVWLAISAAEFFVAEWMAGGMSNLRIGPWWDVPLDLRAWAMSPIAAGVLPLLAAFRTALFRPARQVVDGESLGVRGAARGAFDRLVPVFSTRMSIGTALIAVLMFCSWLVVPMPIWVLLPLGFTLAPALYLVAAKCMTPDDGIASALEISRHHWPAIFAAHGFGLIAILGFMTGGAAYGLYEPWPIFPLNTFGNLQILGAYLAGRYVDWIVVTGTYVYLESDAE